MAGSAVRAFAPFGHEGFLRRMAQQAGRLTGADSSEIVLLHGDDACVISSDSPAPSIVHWSTALVEPWLHGQGLTNFPVMPANARRFDPAHAGERFSACSAVSLCDSDGEFLGALAVYFAAATELSLGMQESLSGFGRLIEVWLQELVAPRTELPSWARSSERGLPLFRCTIGMDGRVQDVGPSWEKVTGFSAPDAIGTPLQQLLLHSSRSAAQGLLDHAFGGGAASACSLVFAGTPPRAVGTVAAQLLFSNGAPDRVFLTGWSEGQAARPSLTCARPAFEEVLHARLRDAVQAGALLPVALLAIDGLARVNESLGFASGEQAMGIVVTRLSACLSSPPCITRIGGDEIAVVLPPCSSPAEAGQMARALLDALDQPLGLDGRDVTVSATLGLVLAPVHASDPDLLLRFAETAVRCVKNRGRSQVALFDPRWLAARHEARRLETDLVRALQQNEFRLQFQPQVRFDGTLAGLEALMEWRHPELGLLPPARFISIAEESGRIGELGEWVLRTAANLAAGWRHRGIFPHRMAVNVSPVQFCQTGFSSLVRAVLIGADLPGSSLELEITESALLDDLAEAHRRMDAIRALGVSLCLDDFGVGYSSLHHLQNLPLDAVKIDRSFIARIAPWSGSLDLIHTITGLARNRGLRIVAEGVETEEQARCLADAHCDLAQGFWFGRPVPASQVEAWLTSGRRWPCIA